MLTVHHCREIHDFNQLVEQNMDLVEQNMDIKSININFPKTNSIFEIPLKYKKVGT